MSPQKRIFLNIAATYGRSLYTLAIGLFCGRWTLMALGAVDYGLMGVVGGMIAFVSFFNSIVATAVGRFYSVAVGAAMKSGNEIEGLEECRRYFNAAVVIHTVIPILVVVIGYPVGTWAVKNFLNIPPDRVSACVWVWRFTCVSCFVGMFNVPFGAMYSAKQEIAELTIYSFVTTTFNALFLYWMVSHPGVWLAKYAAFSCALSVVPQMIIAMRAHMRFPECRFVWQYLKATDKYKPLFTYAFANAWLALSGILSSQGRNIVVNKMLGPACNTAMAIGNTISSHSQYLAQALNSGFCPAINNKIGEEKLDEVRNLSFMTCRIGVVLMLIFALPLALESHEVLTLWLKNPPHFAAEIAVACMVEASYGRMTEGYAIAILGVGKRVLLYSVLAGLTGVITFVLVFVFALCGFGLSSVCWGIVSGMVYLTGVRLVLGRVLIGFSARNWIRTVLLPITALNVVTLIAGALPRFLLPASFYRVVLTTIACESAFIPLVWFVVLTPKEREYIALKFKSKMPFVKGR